MSFAAVGVFLAANAGAIGAGAAVVGAGTSLYSASRTAGAAQQAGQQGAALADPFAGQRGFYQTPTYDIFNQLKTFTGAGYQDDPLYKSLVASGINTVNQGSAAQGMLRSGNREVALQKVGMQAADQTINQRWSQLFGLLGQGSALSGATTGNPGMAGNLSYSGNASASNATNSGTNAFFQSLRGIDWKNLLPTGTGTNTNPAASGNGPFFTGTGYPEGGG